MTAASPGDVALAARLAASAGKMLMDMRRGWTGDGAALGAAGDAAANRHLLSALADARPDDGLLSEERADDGARLAHRRVWIIDPVDGTREYGEGRDDWAVHVGLAVDGAAAVGAVAMPALGLVLRSDAAPPSAHPSGPPRIVVSRSRPPAAADHLARVLGGSIMHMGSAGAKAMAVARGQADIYVHSGGQYEWDNCAPAAVALAHGCHASRLDGSALRYNQANPFLPDLLICRADLADRVLAVLNGI